MNQSGFSIAGLILILPLLLASIMFMFNINHKLDETLILTFACDDTLRPPLNIIQKSTNQILDLNPSIKVLNGLETTTKAAIIAATASGNLYLIPELIKALKQIQNSQKLVKSLQTRLLGALNVQLVLMKQKIRGQFNRQIRTESQANKLLFKKRTISLNIEFPNSHHLQEKNSKRFLSEMELSSDYTRSMIGKIDFVTRYQVNSRFEKWFTAINESKGVCAWRILEKSGRTHKVVMSEGKF